MLKGALIAGLSVDQFYNMTLREVYLLFDARREERDARMWETAWQTAILLQPHVKNGSDITPAKLLGKPEPQTSSERESASIDLSRIQGKATKEQIAQRREQNDKKVIAMRCSKEIQAQREQFLGGNSIPSKAFSWE